MSLCTNRAVKAVIYGSDGRVLMQERDETPGLPYPGCWTFFGGLAEEGESLGAALARELAEELGRTPGRLGPELFQWESHGDCAPTKNHFFAVHCETEIDRLVLSEGQGMAWLSLEELVRVPLTPAVYENFATLLQFLSKFRDGLVRSVEDSLLAYNDLHRKNDRVFYARENPCCLSRQQMFLLKALAELRHIPVFRVCLHTDDQSDIHEMLMVHTVATSVGPLRQEKTSLSYHVFEGALTVAMHDDAGTVVKEYLLGKSQTPETRDVCLRLKANEFRSIHSTSAFSIFLEVASGPFQDSDTIWMNTTRRVESAKT